MILDLTEKEFILVRLAVSMTIDELSEKDKDSLKTLIKKFIESLREHDLLKNMK